MQASGCQDADLAGRYSNKRKKLVASVSALTTLTLQANCAIYNKNRMQASACQDADLAGKYSDIGSKLVASVSALTMLTLQTNIVSR